MSIEERAKRILNLNEFANNCEPISLGHFDLTPPENEQRVLRVAIRVEGGDFIIPKELEWVRPFFEKALNHQREAIKVEHSFSYITVRHGLVTTKTDDEWHLDGFSTRITHIPEQNYIWSSNDATEYLKQNIEIDKRFDPLKNNINFYLEEELKKENIMKCKEKHIYCIDPYILHRRPKLEKQTLRTFVRVSFVPIEINDINNTQNPCLPRKYTKDGVKFRNTLTRFEK